MLYPHTHTHFIYITVVTVSSCVLYKYCTFGHHTPPNPLAAASGSEADARDHHTTRLTAVLLLSPEWNIPHGGALLPSACATQGPWKPP
jgi:type VI protein secretion system component Hcp